MGTEKLGDIEVGWGEETVEGSSAVVRVVQVDERRAVMYNDSQVRVEKRMSESQWRLLLSCSRATFHIAVVGIVSCHHVHVRKSKCKGV